MDLQRTCSEISSLDQQLLRMWNAEASVSRWQPTPQERLSHKQIHYQATLERFERTAAALPQHRYDLKVLLTATYLVKAAGVIDPETLQRALDRIEIYGIRADHILEATIARLHSILARGLEDEEAEKIVIWQVMHAFVPRAFRSTGLAPGRNTTPMAQQLPLFLQGPTTFHLSSRVKERALTLLQTYFNEKVFPELDEDDEEARKPFASLEEALFALGWEATVDAEGSLVFLSFTDRFLSKQDEALAALAPCVTAGSSLLVAIEQEGQYHFAVEGWFFDGTRLHREQAIISFPRSLIETLLRH